MANVTDRLESVLVCPCGAELMVETSADARHFRCRECGEQGAQQRGGQFVFGGFKCAEVQSDWLNRFKEMAKRRFGRFYRQVIDLVSPMYAPPLVQPFLKTFDRATDFVADLGSGPIVYADHVLCVDGCDYPNVHLVANLDRLPLKENSLSGAITFGVLEHVPDPSTHVREILRVLKPGGRVLCFIPFVQAFHASPYDYQRYTESGMRELFRDFEIVDLKIGSGPTSGMLWVLQEWLALVLSFGSLRLYRLLVPLMWVLSPLKYIDILLNHHPAAGVIASGFVVEARKPMAAKSSAETIRRAA